MRRALLGLVMMLTATGSAGAVTLREVVELTKAGLGEEVLLALIEVDGGVFEVDAATLAGLKAAGVSEKVIVALVRSGRTPRLPTEPMEAAPTAVPEQQPREVLYIQQPPTTVVREVAVPFPVYVPLTRPWRGPHVREHRTDEVYPSITAPPLIQGRQRYLTDTPPPPPRQEPVYWGSGGKLRPDAWQPAPAPEKK